MSAQTVEQRPLDALTLAQQQDLRARWYFDLMIDGMKPANRPDCGRWLPLVEMAESAYASSSNGNRGKIVAELLNSCIRTEKFPGLEAMISGTSEPIPSAGESPQETGVEPESSTIPALPEDARLPEGLSAEACQWLDAYADYSKLVSPRGAGLGFLLGADETTPQKFMSDCVGYIPSNYFQLSEEKQQRCPVSVVGIMTNWARFSEP